jgi:hypothetical protein
MSGRMSDAGVAGVATLRAEDPQVRSAPSPDVVVANGAVCWRGGP